MIKKIKINEIEYELCEDYKDNFSLSDIEAKLNDTEYFDNYDYIIGDWSYGKLRLKGFCDKNNKIYKKINDIANKKNYINSNCAYGCSYFVLKKIERNKKNA